MEAPSGRRPTRALSGRSEPVLAHVIGKRSRRRRMARYVRECRSSRRVHHAITLDNGHIVNACLFKDRQMMLDLTHHGGLFIPSCTETCRRGEWRHHLDVDQLGRYLDGASQCWLTWMASNRVLIRRHGTCMSAGHRARCLMPLY